MSPCTVHSSKAVSGKYVEGANGREWTASHDLVPPEMRILRPASELRSRTVTYNFKVDSE